MNAGVPLEQPHTCEVTLRANDFDWAGHLNNSVYVQLLESGRWEWGLACGVDLRDSTLVAVVLQLHLDYLRPVEWNPVGRLRVRTSLAERSAYSFTLAQDVERLDGTVVASGRVRLGLVDRDTQRIHRADLEAMLGTPGAPATPSPRARTAPPTHTPGEPPAVTPTATTGGGPAHPRTTDAAAAPAGPAPVPPAAEATPEAAAPLTPEGVG
ncbi:thioesterase family protein [Streptomyces sp. 796.1]|uniref:thioesterase family protein n=1 Tax=Streptomyces sp. 796.1 TaxID=3163029 RepID=UPI0039C93721